MIKRTVGPKANQPLPADELEADEAAATAGGEAPAGEDTDAIVQAAKAMRETMTEGQPGGRVCLIVDDSRVIRKIAAKIAQALGYSVLEAENGEEALARCKQSMPQLILTDWNMPVMSGLDFVSQLRAIPTPVPPKVVFCTSKGANQDIHEGIAAGADDYVIKPFDRETLQAKLEKLGVA